MKTSYRKFLTTLLFCLSLISVKGQYVTIPDANFAAWLNASGYSACMNGNQLDTTCNAVINATTVGCGFSNINDLTGISYFDNLTTLGCGYNQLNYLPALPATLKYLYCDENHLQSLPQLPTSLLELNCEVNQLSQLPALPATLNSLRCGSNLLNSFPPLPASLHTLNCHGNLFTSLPPLPNSLSVLECTANDLTSLPVLPPNLTYLECRLNYLTSLPTLPSTLGTLRCEGNFITSLPALPPNLFFLESGGNPLMVLPALPASLNALWCWGNQLTSLPTLPPALYDFDCSGNPLGVLPNLPSTLVFLRCGNTQLSSLPAMPSSLKELSCGGNQLTSLPPLPAGLEYLECTNNQLTSIPPIPSIYSLFCDNNQLLSLPDLPDHMDWLYIDNNPNLTCLPPINSINEFTMSGTSITCLPNIINANHGAGVPGVPICDLINPNNCSINWNISGVVFTDTNTNCVADTGELTHPNIKVNLYQAGTLVQQTFTDAIGRYSFSADSGSYTYTLDTIGSSVSMDCPLTGSYTSSINAANPVHAQKNFSVKCKPETFDVGVTTVLNTGGIFRPANYATVSVLAGDMSYSYNLHCAAGVSGLVTVIINGPASFSSVTAGALTPAVNGDTLVYTIADFGTVNFNNDFNFEVQTDTSAQLNDAVCFDVTVMPFVGDSNLTNNTYLHCFTVINSFDPNDKQVNPPGIIDTSQHYLTYTIRFQNTGNAPAQHIYILDTLDSYIDESSIQLIAYSHEPLVQVTGNLVKFNFPNINLVDSVTDEPNSHGFVQYRVKLNDGLPLGTVISNTAYIYFDFNAPVVTNTTNSQINIVSGANNILAVSGNLLIYPNPSRNTCSISAPAFTGSTLSLYDLTGRVLFQQPFNEQATVDMSVLRAGMYIVEIRNREGKTCNAKLLKE